MAVHPSHRRRGLGSLLMQVGIARADELRVEAWMEASLMGRPLYENFGFRSLFKMAFDTERRDASDQWRRMEHEMTPTAFHAMWRPGAKGGSKMPWELGTEEVVRCAR
jgi:predicted N-acetyltransferase YhbS